MPVVQAGEERCGGESGGQEGSTGERFRVGKVGGRIRVGISELRLVSVYWQRHLKSNLHRISALLNACIIVGVNVLIDIRW